jgi:hypothetical protein
LIENAALALGQPVPILPQDADYIHMQTMKPGIMQTLQSGNADIASVALQHYAGHWSQGVNKKQIPDEAINSEKAWIAAVEKQITTIKEGKQIEAQKQQAIAQAEQQAQEIVVNEAAQASLQEQPMV